MFKKITFILLLSFFINEYLSLQFIEKSEVASGSLLTSEPKEYYTAEDIDFMQKQAENNIHALAEKHKKLHNEEFFYKEMFELFLIAIFIYYLTLLQTKIEFVSFSSFCLIYAAPEVYNYGGSLMTYFYLGMLVICIFKAKSKKVILV